MRIRRNASKLLGSTSVYANPWQPPPAAEPTGIVCELNCSPWDVMLIDALPNSSCSLTNPEGEDEDGGISGNLIKTEVEEPISAITSIAAELTVKASMQSDEKKVKKMVERRKKSKGKERVAAEMPITYCKKNDGKGWRCKRPAQLPHTFCSYHLAQTRSYSSNHRAIDHASETTTADNSQNQETASTGGDSNNFYYYYHGFGPWRGKRRGRAATVNAEVEEEVAEDGTTKSMDCDDHDNVVAGEDEYGLDCFDEDDDDDNDCYSMPHQDHPREENGKKNEGELERKRVVKKRGRKPLKSRSLKSLL